MTDSMNFGPDWIRNLSSEGTTGGGATGGTRYQLADYRYGREEMLALFDKNIKPPVSLTNFKCLYSETCLQPLALVPATDEEQRGSGGGGWQPRPNTVVSGPLRGRGGSLERGGRTSRGRGYQYSRPPGGYDAGWGNGEQTEWSPRKEYINQRTTSDNWRRARNEEDDGWRSTGAAGPGRSGGHEKWGRSTSWRGEGDSEERTAPPERGGRTSWNDNRAPLARKSWDSEDHLPEWAMENPTEGGGTFDEKGAFHGSDEEQLEGKPPNKKEIGLQKSTSQQHISTKTQPPQMPSSKSTLSLMKSEDTSHRKEVVNESILKEKQEITSHSLKQKDIVEERKKSVPNISEKIDTDIILQERAKSEGPPKLSKLSEKPPVIQNGPVNDAPRPDDSDFERLQEDFVLKLVVDEEVPKQVPNNFDVGGIQPPPNLVPAPPALDKWFYQDPQGQMQGPFSNIEMAEWYKAGYFSNQLKVRRQCDERFFLLGELITICIGANPFQASIRFPTLKNDITKIPPAEPDILQLQYLSQMAAYKQAQARLLTEPWNAISLQQQQELAAQRLILQQQQQVSQDLQYLQQSQVTNPLIHMINQMQQANKLPGQGLVDKQPQNLPGSLDPHLQLHLLSMQNRLPTTAHPNNLPAGLGNSLSGTLPPPEGLSTSMPSLQTPSLNTGGIPITGIQSNIPVSIGGSINMPRPTSRGSVEQIASNQTNDPISSLLKQLQQQKQPTPPQVDSLWQQNSFTPNNGTAQWQSQGEVPISMWDIQNNAVPTVPSPPLTQSEKLQQALQPKSTKLDKEKEQKQKEEAAARELKKKKELEEKQAKKEAEEKKKQELKRLETERKALEERRKKDEERIKRELEKAKKEAEEKRQRELEEKRRLKEQRKAEEEAKKKSEEQKKLEDERLRQEQKDRETRKLDEEKRIQQEQLRLAKAAPWSQSNANMGLSLAEIQKAEREKRAFDAALQIQRLQEKEQHQQLQQEKTPAAQFNWAKKPVEPRKVKSLAEIQAEEQVKLAKQAAETRLQKEKEPLPVINNTSSSIWSNQNLTWASASSANWSSSSEMHLANFAGGFWEDSSIKQYQQQQQHHPQQQGVTKPSTVSKSNSTNTSSAAPKPQTQKPVKNTNTKTKKDESNKTNHNNNNNGPSSDEFMNWCYKTLSNISTNVDIPTFVTFLRDIESAFDVKEYCKEYLGDNNATHQFAVNFLEKRRSFKPKNNAHKDDMCSPAPAITPSLQHSTEFQEVKGKNKKIKKSKMLKVDSRILGFNVTSAPDRINVGDRDYGDNS